MGTYEFDLVTGDRNWEEPYWIDHLAGLILMEDARNEGLRQIDPALSDEAKAAARKAIDDTLYGLMQTVEGITSLANEEYYAELNLVVVLKNQDDEVVASLDLRECDGACMGYHMWTSGDFGDVPIARRRPPRRM